MKESYGREETYFPLSDIALTLSSAIMVDHYTHLPNAQKPAAKMQQTSALHGILGHIADSITVDEQNIALLLHAFDLSSEGLMADAPESPPYTSPPRTPYHRLKHLKTPSPDSVPRSRHPFLLTPIRKEHFPSLDPLILRELLRSPCDYEGPSSIDMVQTPDSKRGISTTQTPEIRISLASLDNCSPPPSPSPPQLPSRLLPSARSLETEQQISEFQSSPVAKLASPTRQQPRSLNPDVSSLAIKDFHLVLDEMEGLNTRASSRCKSTDEEKTSVTVVSEGQLAASPVIDANLHQPPSVPGTRISVLYKEFATILTDKAAVEEEASDMLRTLADRMQDLAEKRKALVVAVTSPNDLHAL